MATLRRRRPIGRTTIDATEVGSRPAGAQDRQAPEGPRLRRSPARRLLLPGLVLLGPLVTVLLLRHDRLWLSSDSIAQQSVVRTWYELGHDETYLPPNTWLLKLPVYLVVEGLPLAPGTRFLVEIVTIHAIAFTLLAVAAWWFAGVVGTRRWTDAVLPLTWISTLGGGIGSYLSVMPNYRNVELGLSFLLLVLTGRFTTAPTPDGAPVRARRLAAADLRLPAVAVVLLAVLWVDDPYFAFLVGLPLMAAAVAWYFLRQRDARLLALAAVLGASLLAIPLVRLLLAAVGVHVVPDTTSPTLVPAEIVSHLPILWPSLEAQLGLDEPGAAAGPAHLLSLVVLAAGVVAGGYLTLLGWRSRNLAVTVLGAHWPVVVAGVLTNRTVYDFHAGRYLVLALYDLAITLGVTAAAVRGRRPRLAAGITGLLVTAAVANGVTAVVDRPEQEPAVAAQRATLEVLRSTGAAKAYGGFWSANIYTYLSQGSVQMTDVICTSGRLRLRTWLNDTARTRFVPPPGRPVVVLWEPGAFNFRGCTRAGVEAQLGRPTRVLPAPQGQEVLLYDRDVLDRLDPAPDPPQALPGRGRGGVVGVAGVGVVDVGGVSR